MPPIGQGHGNRDGADKGRKGTLGLGQMPGFEVPQQLGGARLGGGERTGELRGGQSAKPEQQHPGEVKP